jgi:hypothetical protein
MCVIRKDFIEQDLRNILSGCAIKERKVLYAAYKDIIVKLAEEVDGVRIPYSVYSKEDMLELLKDYDKLNAFAIRDLVADYENNETHSEYFYMVGDSYEFYSMEEWEKEVEQFIPSIAFEILIRPFDGVFKQLYNMIVVPMVLNQK